jgi:hypothetical protein
MTFKTITVGHTQFIKYLSYGMGSMTVYTDRYFIGLFLPEFALNDFLMNGFNLAVTFLAGFGHIVFMNGGVLIGVGKHIMGGVAIGAHSRNGKPFMKQALAVYTKRIMSQDAVLRDIIASVDFGALLMAFAAHIRNIKLGYPGIRQVVRNNIVFPVTIPASRSQFYSPGHLLTMQAFGVSFSDIIVTYTTIHGLEILIMGKILEIGQVRVTIHAFEFAMRGFREYRYKGK